MTSAEGKVECGQGIERFECGDVQKEEEEQSPGPVGRTCRAETFKNRDQSVFAGGQCGATAVPEFDGLLNRARVPPRPGDGFQSGESLSRNSATHVPLEPVTYSAIGVFSSRTLTTENCPLPGDAESSPARNFGQPSTVREAQERSLVTPTTHYYRELASKVINHGVFR